MKEYSILTCGCVVSAEKKRKLWHYEIIMYGCGSSSAKFTDVLSPIERKGTPLTQLEVAIMKMQGKIK